MCSAPSSCFGLSRVDRGITARPREYLCKAYAMVARKGPRSNVKLEPGRAAFVERGTCSCEISGGAIADTRCIAREYDITSTANDRGCFTETLITPRNCMSSGWVKLAVYGHPKSHTTYPNPPHLRRLKAQQAITVSSEICGLRWSPRLGDSEPTATTRKVPSAGL